MLDIKGLNKSFHLSNDPILEDINLRLDEGELCFVLGANGSGKSTLLKTILGEYKADSGEIYLAGKSISNIPMHKRSSMISSVVQDVAKGTIAEMTLLENLVISSLRSKNPCFGLYSNYTHQMHAAVAELGFGLEKYLHMPVACLSGSQRQIISTLMAMMGDTKLLMLDEHTSGLDAKTRLLLMKYTIEKIESSKITTLMVTHNFNDVLDYGDRVIILEGGRVARDISGREKLSLTKDHLLRLFHFAQDVER